jgi:hypothetical protein
MVYVGMFRVWESDSKFSLIKKMIRPEKKDVIWEKVKEIITFCGTEKLNMDEVDVLLKILVESFEDIKEEENGN